MNEYRRFIRELARNLQKLLALKGFPSVRARVDVAGQLNITMPFFKDGSPEAQAQRETIAKIIKEYLAQVDYKPATHEACKRKPHSPSSEEQSFSA